MFSVLGDVSGFREGTSILNREDFSSWLSANEDNLGERVRSWIPEKLSPGDRDALLSGMVEDCLTAVDEAIRRGPDEAEAEQADDTDEESEDQAEEGEERPSQAHSCGKLLDRLLYCGKLPRYAFPTDVATFHVFDRDRSTAFRPIMRFAPAQGLLIALSQYAPGKQVWISGKCYTSGAVYSVMADDRYEAWRSRRIYMECSKCGYAKTDHLGNVSRGDVKDCPACGSEESFGPARYWMRPPGFAHPVDAEEVTSPDDIPETSYATRAKLTMGTPDEDAGWIAINERVRVLRSREHLLVSNAGPKKDGYTYCTKCGRIEASTDPSPKLIGPHRKPYPDEDDKLICDGMSPSRHIILGTDFITDIALFSMRVAPPLKLKPGHSSTVVALRTLSEALARAACQLLEIEPSELMAEFRPALTPSGVAGLEAEIFLYDTLPGGAGFSSQLADQGLELLHLALELMKSCPENCDASCYRCLRSFKNKFDHSLLDRHTGTQLLEYLLNGERPKFSPERMRVATTLLYHDLLRQPADRAKFALGASVQADGATLTAPILAEVGQHKFIIALSGPLTDEHPVDAAIDQLRSAGNIAVIVENELVVRSNLPHATRSVLQKLRVIA